MSDRRLARRGAAVPRRRLAALLLVLAVAFVAVVGRLTFVQGFSAGPYAAKGLSERLHTVILPAGRGSIFDRNGDELAISVPQSTVWADPRLVTEPAREAQALASVLHLDPTAVGERLTRPGAFSYVARMVDDATAHQVEALNLAGISLLDEPRRFAPDQTLAAPVVGQVGADNTGLSGLEAQYQADLAGHPGRLVSEDDPSGRPIPGGLRRLSPATRGSDLVLTIDRSLQYEVEQELSSQITATRAKGGMAVVMDCRTGEVAAMASLVDASDGSGVVPAPSNEVVTSVYEPGSVQKLITLSAALEDKVVQPSDTFSVPDSMRVADATFRDDNPHPMERWSVTDILTASSNVGTINIGRKLGKDGLTTYLHRFGLGSRTALSFPGESGGLLLDPARWSGTTIATVPIGQGLAVTAMQLTAAYNAVANGGVYVAPKLVRSMVDAQGRMVPTPPSATHQVVSPETARQMGAMLTEVVRTGTGTAAAIDGYHVAGKTGTARKTVDGRYKDGAYTASFAGFVPAEHPAFTAMVVLDEPTPIYGGLVAAPVFAKVASYALRQMQVPPPAPDPSLFDGVPHAGATATSAADEPTSPGRGTTPAGSATISSTSAAAPTGSGAGSGMATRSGAPTRGGAATRSATTAGSGAGSGASHPGSDTTTTAGATRDPGVGATRRSAAPAPGADPSIETGGLRAPPALAGTGVQSVSARLVGLAQVARAGSVVRPLGRPPPTPRIQP